MHCSKIKLYMVYLLIFSAYGCVSICWCKRRERRERRRQTFSYLRIVHVHKKNASFFAWFEWWKVISFARKRTTHRTYSYVLDIARFRRNGKWTVKRITASLPPFVLRQYTLEIRSLFINYFSMNKGFPRVLIPAALSCAVLWPCQFYIRHLSMHMNIEMHHHYWMFSVLLEFLYLFYTIVKISKSRISFPLCLFHVWISSLEVFNSLSKINYFITRQTKINSSISDN